jgi:hypothetical protein
MFGPYPGLQSTHMVPSALGTPAGVSQCLHLGSPGGRTIPTGHTNAKDILLASMLPAVGEDINGDFGSCSCLFRFDRADEALDVITRSNAAFVPPVCRARCHSCCSLRPPPAARTFEIWMVDALIPSASAISATIVSMNLSCAGPGTRAAFFTATSIFVIGTTFEPGVLRTSATTAGSLILAPFLISSQRVLSGLDIFPPAHFWHLPTIKLKVLPVHWTQLVRFWLGPLPAGHIVHVDLRALTTLGAWHSVHCTPKEE